MTRYASVPLAAAACAAALLAPSGRGLHVAAALLLALLLPGTAVAPLLTADPAARLLVAVVLSISTTGLAGLALAAFGAFTRGAVLAALVGTTLGGAVLRAAAARESPQPIAVRRGLAAGMLAVSVGALPVAAVFWKDVQSARSADTATSLALSLRPGPGGVAVEVRAPGKRPFAGQVVVDPDRGSRARRHRIEVPAGGARRVDLGLAAQRSRPVIVELRQSGKVVRRLALAPTRGTGGS